ncbi:MAG: glutamine amidotransferase [Firmicutes bacterium ML8_F2]|jgi:lipid II isoglutaminyl synthase (glutamine-hydrolysing)|nr:MAG: glutamine amidotransferase [Firmicutes bacterium ML8_F2]
MARIRLFHLYPEHLNLYGDRGNMLALCRRAEWRNIAIEIVSIKPGENINFSSCDLLFMGGGQDSDQKLIVEDLKKRRDELKIAAENGMVIFSVCGSYQLLGNYYVAVGGEKLAGLGIIDLYTEAGSRRLIGNAVIDCPLWQPPKTLVGFENHAGKTYLGSSVQPLGTVLTGFGNNGSDKTEGAVYKNVIGTYLHGSLLPKNPWLTDYLLGKALSYRGTPVKLASLDDSLEQRAHDSAIALARSRRHKRLSTRA